jgi:hypothetical protein
VASEYLGKQPRAEPPALAEYLVSKGVLTQFQAERVLQGRARRVRGVSALLAASFALA